ncbi:MAG: 30S ribosomal protein S21 [Candidatus Buchananbacteria bacterium]|nr:30S ribosomal protein S21 [Candidatus Buchananbacteria bacterium]
MSRATEDRLVVVVGERSITDCIKRLNRLSKDAGILGGKRTKGPRHQTRSQKRRNKDYRARKRVELRKRKTNQAKNRRDKGGKTSP